MHGVDVDEVPCLIRQLLGDGQPRDRDTTLRELASSLGHQRLGHRVRSQLETGLRTCVRRGVVQNARGQLSILNRTIGDYDFRFLKTQLLPAMGRSWITRKDVTQCLARWLGFRRTGPVIEKTVRSLINALLREGSLEKNGPEWLRRV
jgi:hypothetical protein